MRNEISIEVEQAGQGTGTACTQDPAFEVLFRTYQRFVYGCIRRIVRDSGIAEDLTLETFWRIHRALGRFDPQREFAPWARRIATRVALDWLRTQHRDQSEPQEYFAAQPAPQHGDAAVDAEVRLRVAQALGRLPPKLRVAALLAVVEDRPQKEVAASLGITVAAVKLRVFRALRLLRRDLQRQGITP